MNNLSKPTEYKSKDEIRTQIDKIDHEIITLFARRFEYVKEIVKLKENNLDAIIRIEQKEAIQMDSLFLFYINTLN